MKISGEIIIKVRYDIEGTSSDISDFRDVLGLLADNHYDLAVAPTVRKMIRGNALVENEGVVSVEVEEIEVT